MLNELERWSEALGELESIIARSPASNAYIEYAIALAHLGRRSEAEQALQAAEVLAPNAPGLRQAWELVRNGA